MKRTLVLFLVLLSCTVVTAAAKMVPGTPDLVSPADGATGQPHDVTLRWNAASRATTYQVRIQIGSQLPVTAPAGNVTSYTVRGLPDSTGVVWSVKAGNKWAWGKWSQNWYFRTLEPAPLPPEEPGKKPGFLLCLAERPDSIVNTSATTNAAATIRWWKQQGGTGVIMPTCYYSSTWQLENGDPWRTRNSYHSIYNLTDSLGLENWRWDVKLTHSPMSGDPKDWGYATLKPRTAGNDLLPQFSKTAGELGPNEGVWLPVQITDAQQDRLYHAEFWSDGPMLFRWTQDSLRDGKFFDNGWQGSDSADLPTCWSDNWVLLVRNGSQTASAHWEIRRFAETDPDPASVIGRTDSTYLWTGNGRKFCIAWDHPRYDDPATLARFLANQQIISAEYDGHVSAVGGFGAGDEPHFHEGADWAAVLGRFEHEYAIGHYAIAQKPLLLWTIYGYSGYYANDWRGGGTAQWWPQFDGNEHIYWILYNERPPSIEYLRDGLSKGERVYVFVPLEFDLTEALRVANEWAAVLPLATPDEIQRTGAMLYCEQWGDTVNARPAMAVLEALKP